MEETYSIQKYSEDKEKTKEIKINKLKIKELSLENQKLKNELDEANDEIRELSDKIDNSFSQSPLLELKITKNDSGK